jgi:ubiquinone biosynthesis monooxygenase Coq7
MNNISNRPMPQPTIPMIHPLSSDELKVSIAFMRINHSGEVAAQALYRGQALTARDPKLKVHLLHTAEEEYDHLVWCQQRLNLLGGRSSYLKPLWYWGSYVLGICVGLLGDAISLGFVAETEFQVTQHLEEHLAKLPPKDTQSHAILTQMRDDERQHALMAQQYGGIPFPKAVKYIMRCLAKVLTFCSAYV